MAGSFGFNNLINPGLFQPHDAGISFAQTSLNHINNALASGGGMDLVFSPTAGDDGASVRYNNQFVGYLPGSAFNQSTGSNDGATGLVPGPNLAEPNDLPTALEGGDGASDTTADTTTGTSGVDFPGTNTQANPDQVFESTPPTGQLPDPSGGGGATDLSNIGFTGEWRDAYSQANQIWDPVRYSSVPSTVFADLARQGMGAPIGQGDAALDYWWQTQFLPAYNERMSGLKTSTGSGSTWSDLGNAIMGLFGFASPSDMQIPELSVLQNFDPSQLGSPPGGVNVPVTYDFPDLPTGVEVPLTYDIPPLPTFNPIDLTVNTPDLTPFENRISGIERGLGRIGMFSEPAAIGDTFDTATETVGLLDDILGFREPAAIGNAKTTAQELVDLLNSNAIGSFGSEGGFLEDLSSAIDDARLLQTELTSDDITGFENPEGLTEALSTVNQIRTQSPLARSGIQHIINTARGGEDTLGMLSTIVGGVPETGNLGSTLERFNPTSLINTAIGGALDQRLGGFADRVGGAIDIPEVLDSGNLSTLRENISEDTTTALTDSARFDPLDTLSTDLSPLSTMRSDIVGDITPELEPLDKLDILDTLQSDIKGDRDRGFRTQREYLAGDLATALANNARFDPLDTLATDLSPLSTLRNDIVGDIRPDLTTMEEDIVRDITGDDRFDPLDSLTTKLSPLDTLREDRRLDIAAELDSSEKLGDIQGAVDDAIIKLSPLDTMVTDIGSEVDRKLSSSDRFNVLDTLDLPASLESLRGDIATDTSSALTDSTRFNPLDDLESKLSPLSTLRSDIASDITGDDRFDPLDTLNTKLSPLNTLRGDIVGDITGDDRFDPLDSLGTDLQDLRTDIGGDTSGLLLASDRFDPLDRLGMDLRDLRTDVVSDITGDAMFNPLEQITTLRGDIGSDIAGEINYNRRFSPLDDLSDDLEGLRSNIGSDFSAELGQNARLNPLDNLSGDLSELRTDIGGDFAERLRTDNRLNPLDELEGRLSPLETLRSDISGDLRPDIAGIPGDTADLINPSIDELTGGLGGFLPEDLKELPGNLEEVPGDVGALRSILEGPGGINYLADTVGDTNEILKETDFATPQDVQGISAEDLEEILASFGTGGGGDAPSAPDGGLPLTETDSGEFLGNLLSVIESNYGSFNPTADELREDPITRSLLADLEYSQERSERQTLEDLSRLGVLRDGDTARILPEIRSDYRREELSALAQAAQRRQDAAQTATSQGLDLGGLMTSRELGIADLLGQIGGKQTLSGRQADLDIIGAVLAALDPSLNGKFDDFAGVILDLAQGLDPILRNRLRNAILN